MTTGTLSGDGEIFSFDLFADGVTSDVVMVSLTFDIDLSEVSLFDYDPSLGMQVFGTTDSSVVFGVVFVQDVSDGYLGRVDFISASDLSGIPTTVKVRRATFASVETILTDDADVSSAVVILNEVVDFADFLIFANGFGLTSNDEGFDARLDYDATGEIGFFDFLVFVPDFGLTSA